MHDDQALTPPGGGAHVEPWLDAYRTGELADSESLRVERHLERCPDCAARLAEIDSFARLVARGFTAATAGPLAAEPDWSRQRREILARTVEPQPVERRPTRLFRLAPQAALAVLALLVLGILARQGLRSPADLERALEKERRGAPSAPEPARGPAGGHEAPSPPADSFQQGFEGRPSDSDSFPLSAGLQRVPSADSALEAPAPLTDRDGAAAPGRPAGVGGAVGGFAQGPQARGEEREELAAAAPAAHAERKRAAAQNEVAPQPAAEGAEEADFRGQDHRAQAPPSAANDSGLLADEVQPTRQDSPGPPAPAPMDLLQRLDLYARKALASRDSVDAARALALWRDSVAVRGDLDPARKRAAAALVDSLARQAPR